MTVALVDTSGFYAAMDADDLHHRETLDKFRLAETDDWHLITHNYIVHETWALVQARLGWEAVDQWARVLLPRCEIIWVDEALHTLSAARCRQARERRLSLTDCVSLELMFRENFQDVIGYDAHLSSGAD